MSPSEVGNKSCRVTKKYSVNDMLYLTLSLPFLTTASADFPYNPGQGQAIRNGVNRNSAIIGGVIAVVIFTILCTLVFLIRYMFRHKGTYHTNEAKGAESAESADAAIMNNDPNFTETIDESKKEWLI
ncbi:Contactin-associated protein-like 2 [Galemys pyrenaicus]|uniref:Contactin-associated protein-like 2 n=1 Tax=Galemys pyrenaicus TaxID=202257 RepID=A0A8J6DK04_GALPY|nr:Contactin-associated protein-like 2 [Galemys pyrenaicus]